MSYQKLIIIGNKGCEDVHWDCKIAQLEAELKITAEKRDKK